MKNWMKVVASTAFAAIGSVALTVSAFGQIFPPERSFCEIRADEVAVDGQPFVSVGTMELSPGESSDGRMQLLTDAFNAQSDDTPFGVVTWELDNSREPVTTSFIRSNNPGELFPATVQLDFNVRATINGRVFLSRTPVSIGNENVMSWPPGEIELNSVVREDGVVDEVEFFPEGNPGETAFRVNWIRSWVRD